MRRIYWPATIEEAKVLQLELRGRVRIEPLKKAPRFVAGCDASYSGTRVIGAACLYSLPGLEHIESAVSALECLFPYVPGYLSFREGPAIVAALEKLRTKPDVLLMDGQGIAHPRGLGIASHLGALLGISSVGCAKSRLVGTYREPRVKKGENSSLYHEGEVVGAVLRTRTGVKPVFVSPGHGTDVAGAVSLVLLTTGRYRLPEPIRCAHKAAAEAAKVV